MLVFILTTMVWGNMFCFRIQSKSYPSKQNLLNWPKLVHFFKKCFEHRRQLAKIHQKIFRTLVYNSTSQTNGVLCHLSIHCMLKQYKTTLNPISLKIVYFKIIWADFIFKCRSCYDAVIFICRFCSGTAEPRHKTQTSSNDPKVNDLLWKGRSQHSRREAPNNSKTRQYDSKLYYDLAEFPTFQSPNLQQNQLIKKKHARMTQKLWIRVVVTFVNVNNKRYMRN